MLVDSHCHLDADSCSRGADAALDDAVAAGVRAFVAIGVGDVSAMQQTVALAERRRDVTATVGVHPHDAARADDTVVAEVARLAQSDRIVAIGEVGLDYHYDNSPRDVQQAVFRRFVSMARDRRLPLVIHTRAARTDTLEILRSEGAADVGGVIHCFSEDREFARGALDLGFDLSFSGIVTFKNAKDVHDVAAWAPADRILVETDSPYLAPVPRRGKTNEPAFVVHTARRVAELRNVTYDQLAEQTTANARRRFGPLLETSIDG